MARRYSDSNPEEDRSKRHASPEPRLTSSEAADEYSPLIRKKSASDQAPNGTEDIDVGDILPEDETSTRMLILHEFWVLFRGSIPVIMAYTLQNSLQTVSILIVGRASPQDLSTAAFSYMFAMCSGWLIGMGGSTALDTLASSTFTGSKNKHDLGILLQRSFLVLGLFYVPVAVLWTVSEHLFRLLGQPEQLCKDSAKFLTCLIPGGLGYIAFETMKKYLQAQEIMRPGTYVLLITSPISAALNYLFVYTLGYWLSFLGLVLYARFVAGGECWGGFSRRALQNLGTFAKLAALGVVHVGTEWWAFEIVALAAGRLGEVDLASQSVIMTADQVLNTIPFGIGVAASARVGNMLGLRNGKGAARSANTAAWLSMLMGGVVLAILLATKNVFAKIFNDDEAVVKLTAEVLPYVALFQVADGLNGSCGGSLRGMGRQHIGE
ncbi:ethionine resistance protein [Lithohypha guttulata]|uniref:Ethionine resistance protein n=1 Tax=Lithohypha guttulata TaxID=1690604 RepID=A0AAN7T0A6_9EURO|nr:ethionine resistance protein [Lithohypha guttulata]KAK5085270.1 ethionine resistance protein [Lithohypha guttulata]